MILLLFSHSVVSASLWPHGLQHCMLPCPSPSPQVYLNSCPSSRWWHPTISSSVIPFSSCPQCFPASGSFPVSQFFTSGGQSIGASASALALPINIQSWFPLGLTGLISLQSKGLSGVFSSTTVRKHPFFKVHHHDDIRTQSTVHAITLWERTHFEDVLPQDHLLHSFPSPPTWSHQQGLPHLTGQLAPTSSSHGHQSRVVLSVPYSPMSGQLPVPTHSLSPAQGQGSLSPPALLPSSNVFQGYFLPPPSWFSRGPVFLKLSHTPTTSAECQGMDAFKTWCWRRLLKVPWTPRRSNLPW